MKVRSRFATDRDAENNGVWVDIGDGARLKVARFGNDAHKDVLDRLRKPFRNILRVGGEIPIDRATEITIESVAEAVLLDWDGIEDDDGTAIPYSKEAAIELMTDLKDFRDQVAAIASEQEVFRVAALEQAAKNSKRGSIGRPALATKRAS